MGRDGVGQPGPQPGDGHAHDAEAHELDGEDGEEDARRIAEGFVAGLVGDFDQLVGVLIGGVKLGLGESLP